jgi:hypothetical protein
MAEVASLIAKPDIIGAFAASFVNPYSSGYSVDVIACWLILTIWIIYEAKNRQIKYGRICIPWRSCRFCIVFKP